MTVLPDVNVLMALAWPNHVQHEVATRWFQEMHVRHAWATCPLTQSGFVRVSSNSRIIPGACTPGEAIGVLRRLVRLGNHVFWSDHVSLADSVDLIRADRLVGYRQVTGAHLLALVLHKGGQLVTFDRAVAHLVPAPWSAAEVLVLL